MSTRGLPTSITVGLLTCGLAAVAPATGSARTPLPDETTYITLTGCFLHQMVYEKGKQKEEYVLVRPMIGSVASVPRATCTSTGRDQAIELEHVKNHPDEHHLDTSWLGRWIEVTGKLEKFENASELREMNVKSFRGVPVVVPRATATHTTSQLPPTASTLPLTGLIGVLALAGALALRLFVHRRTSERGRIDVDIERQSFKLTPKE
jgi:hypothetical protein